MNTSTTIKEVLFDSDSLSLAGSVCLPDLPNQIKPPGVLMLHGAGNNGGRIFYRRTQEHLRDAGFGSFAFDVRGVGDSEPIGQFQLSTLNNRLLDAISAYHYFMSLNVVDENSLALLCNSMSGHTAAKLVGIWPSRFKVLILKNAAAYVAESEDKLMKALGQDTSEFSLAVRDPDNKRWRESPAFDFVSAFRGPVLAVGSEHEEVLPDGIYAKWHNAVSGVYEQYILKEAGHFYITRDDPQSLSFQDEFAAAAISFLNRYL